MTNDINDWMNGLDQRTMVNMREMSCVAMITLIITKHMDLDYYMAK